MKKTFDCVEMKRQVQAKLMAEYEVRKNEFISYAEFIHKTAAIDPKILAFKERIIANRGNMESVGRTPIILASPRTSSTKHKRHNID